MISRNSNNKNISTELRFPLDFGFELIFFTNDIDHMVFLARKFCVQWRCAPSQEARQTTKFSTLPAADVMWLTVNRPIYFFFFFSASCFVCVCRACVYDVFELRRMIALLSHRNSFVQFDITHIVRSQHTHTQHQLQIVSKKNKTKMGLRCPSTERLCTSKERTHKQTILPLQ